MEWVLLAGAAAIGLALAKEDAQKEDPPDDTVLMGPHREGPGPYVHHQNRFETNARDLKRMAEDKFRQVHDPNNIFTIDPETGLATRFSLDVNRSPVFANQSVAQQGPADPDGMDYIRRQIDDKIKANNPDEGRKLAKGYKFNSMSEAKLEAFSGFLPPDAPPRTERWNDDFNLRVAGGIANQFETVQNSVTDLRDRMERAENKGVRGNRDYEPPFLPEITGGARLADDIRFLPRNIDDTRNPLNPKLVAPGIVVQGQMAQERAPLPSAPDNQFDLTKYTRVEESPKHTAAFFRQERQLGVAKKKLREALADPSYVGIISPTMKEPFTRKYNNDFDKKDFVQKAHRLQRNQKPPSLEAPSIPTFNLQDLGNVFEIHSDQYGAPAAPSLLGDARMSPSVIQNVLTNTVDLEVPDHNKGFAKSHPMPGVNRPKANLIAPEAAYEHSGLINEKVSMPSALPNRPRYIIDDASSIKPDAVYNAQHHAGRQNPAFGKLFNREGDHTMHFKQQYDGPPLPAQTTRLGQQNPLQRNGGAVSALIKDDLSDYGRFNPGQARQEQDVSNSVHHLKHHVSAAAVVNPRAVYAPEMHRKSNTMIQLNRELGPTNRQSVPNVSPMARVERLSSVVQLKN